MYTKFFADTILILHFLVIIFIISLYFLIPYGYSKNWKFVKNYKIRLAHLMLIFFITLETFLGIICPLTTLENYLRGQSYSETFISFWISKVIYWDLPTTFFIVVYTIFLIFAIILWLKFLPKKNHN